MEEMPDIVSMLSQVYAPQCKIVRSGLYIAILPYYMGNLWSKHIGRDVSIIAIVNPVPEDAPKMLKIMGGRIPMKRKIRTIRNPKGASYVITLPKPLNEIWEYLYKRGIKIDIIAFLN